MRYIPLSLDDLWETSTDLFHHTENFLGNFKVHTLAQVSQNKFLPLTELPHFGRFSLTHFSECLDFQQFQVV